MNQRFRRNSIAAFLLVITSCVQALGQQKTVVIHAGPMIDTTHKQVRDHISIVIEGSRISAVQDGFVSPKDAEIIDLSNATVVPGLIDCHKHLTAHLGTGSHFQDLVTENIADSAFYATANAKTTLLNGFTSVRDVGARDTVDVALKKAIEKDLVAGHY